MCAEPSNNLKICKVREWMRQSERGRTSCKDPLITGCLNVLITSDILDVIYSVALVINYNPPSIHRLHWQAHIVSVLCLILSQPLSPPVIDFERTRARMRLTEEVLIFVDDMHKSSVSLSSHSFRLSSNEHLITELSLWHALSFAPTSRGPSRAEEPGKDLSDGSTVKIWAQAELRMIYRAYFWEW